MECLPYEDRAYETRRMEMDRSCQHVAFTVDTAAQTEFQHPRAASTQSQPRQMTEEQVRPHRRTGGRTKPLLESWESATLIVLKVM